MRLFKAVFAVGGLFTMLGIGSAMDESLAAQPGTGSGAVTLVCTVAGAPKGNAAFERAALCRNFAQRIGPALDAKVVLADVLPKGAAARWVRLELKLQSPSRIEAALTSHLHGKATNYPPLGVQVVDKPLGLREIDRLASLVAKSLA